MSVSIQDDCVPDDCVPDDCVPDDCVPDDCVPDDVGVGFDGTRKNLRFQTVARALNLATRGRSCGAFAGTRTALGARIQEQRIAQPIPRFR